MTDKELEMTEVYDLPKTEGDTGIKRRSKVEMNFEETLKEYFEKIVTEDTAISAVYDEAKINSCANYIVAQAKKQASKNCAVVSDEVVYKWARDFYLGDIEEDYKEDKSENVQIVQSGADDEEAAEEKPKKVTKPKVSKPNFEKEQLNLFEF